jgi:hypothetical protein
MKVKTSELTGVALDWAVAQATGANVRIHTFEGNGAVQMVFDLENGHLLATYSPSNSWNQCGPLIEKFRIELRTSGVRRWYADKVFPHGAGEEDWCGFGYTALSAVCRAIVTAKLGDEIELPSELFRQEPEKP